MKKDEWEDINVNGRSDDKIRFESNFIQSIADKIDFLKDESKEILKDLDSTEFKQQLDELDLEDFSEKTIDQIDDLFDDISRFKSEIVSSEDFPEDVKEQYRNTQIYLNRDQDYIRRAKRKLTKLNSGEFIDFYKTNIRIIELCDKAIGLRKDNFEAYYIKAQALVNLEKYPQAIDEFVNALLIRDDVEVWLAIANANRLNGDFSDAIDVYNSILKKYGESAKAIKGKAHTYFDMKEYAKCDEMFKQANSIEYLDEDSFKIWSECLKHLKKD